MRAEKEGGKRAFDSFVERVDESLDSSTVREGKLSD